MTTEQKPEKPIQNTQDNTATNPSQPAADDDWLAGAVACNRDDPECEACQ